MLDLNSQEWPKLSHAYGKASDIPDLIKRLENHPPSTSHQSEPYYSLWSALCPQGDTYSASIAALPHLVRYCESAPDKADWSIAQLAVCIEISRLEGRCSNDISDKVYRVAVKKLALIADNMRKAQPNDEIKQIYKAALLVARGDWELADAILTED